MKKVNPIQNKPTISRDEAIKQVTAQLTGPTPLEEFVKQVLSIWPSKAKNPAAGVRQALRDYQAGQSIIFLTDQMVAPIGLALRGVRFRINLDPAEVSQGEISIYPNFR
jgi:hypothetical protein